MPVMAVVLVKVVLAVAGLRSSWWCPRLRSVGGVSGCGGDCGVDGNFGSGCVIWRRVGGVGSGSGRSASAVYVSSVSEVLVVSVKWQQSSGGGGFGKQMKRR